MRTEQSAQQPEGGAREVSRESSQPERLQPEIWVGATSDYDGERRYGGWLDAAQDTGALHEQIRAIIDRTPDPLRQSWHIQDVRGFGWWHPERRYGLPTVNRIARGIAYYGAPYSALVDLVGAESPAAGSERFEDSYLGDWPTMRSFVEQFAEQAGWQRRLQQLPEGMRPYVDLDFDRMIRIARRDLAVVEHSSGLWVFQPRNW
jgi:hypothetical protein